MVNSIRKDMAKKEEINVGVVKGMRALGLFVALQFVGVKERAQ